MRSFSARESSQAERDVIANHPDTLFVVAAGNRQTPADPTADSQYPCAYPVGNILCVGASDARRRPPELLPVRRRPSTSSPPATGSSQPTKDGGYRVTSGTSAAAPHVAGEAALLLARNPGLDIPAVVNAILQSGDVKPAFIGKSVTGQRANALTALESVTADRDGDGVADDAPDNCPTVPNPEQEDSETDGVGDACGPDAPEPDSDGDEVGDTTDRCPYEPGTAAAQGCRGEAPNSDSDTRLDVFDNCDATPNEDQADDDGDKQGNSCDSTPRGPDADSDGKPALDDACPERLWNARERLPRAQTEPHTQSHSDSGPQRRRRQPA